MLGSKWGTPRVVIGNQLDTHAISIHPSAILLEQRIMCVLHMSGVQAFHSPLISPTSPPIKWSHLLFLKPQRLGHPTCCSNHSLLREGLHQCNPFFFPESTPRGTGLQHMKVKSESEVTQSCLIGLLASPWTAAYQAPPSMG